MLARVADRARLESALEGWQEQCGRPRSLAWLRERTGRLGYRLGERARVAQALLAAGVTAGGGVLVSS